MGPAEFPVVDPVVISYSKRRMKSFKFIEGVIVVLVVSGLFLFTLNQFDLARKKARDVQRRNDLRSMARTILSYYNDYGKFPAETVINNLWGKEFNDQGYIYMKVVPKENYFDKEYCYKVGTGGSYSQLFTDLENDPECMKDLYTCGGKDYCYTEVIYAKKK